MFKLWNTSSSYINHKIQVCVEDFTKWGKSKFGEVKKEIKIWKLPLMIFLKVKKFGGVNDLERFGRNMEIVILNFSITKHPKGKEGIRLT